MALYGFYETVDDTIVCAAGCDHAVLQFLLIKIPLGFLLLFGIVRFNVRYGVTDKFLDAGAADVNVAANGRFAGFVDHCSLQIKPYFHTLPCAFWAYFSIGPSCLYR